MSLYTAVLTLTYLLHGAESLLGSWPVNFAASQEIPRIYGTRKSLTVPTSARHLSLSWANSIQSPWPPPTSFRSILILSSHLRLGLPNGLFPSGFRNIYLQARRVHVLVYSSFNAGKNEIFILNSELSTDVLTTIQNYQQTYWRQFIKVNNCWDILFFLSLSLSLLFLTKYINTLGTGDADLRF